MLQLQLATFFASIPFKRWIVLDPVLEDYTPSDFAVDTSLHTFSLVLISLRIIGEGTIALALQLFMFGESILSRQLDYSRGGEGMYYISSQRLQTAARANWEFENLR
jgi:hypothetical protein